jgi:hypothetical protein
MKKLIYILSIAILFSCTVAQKQVQISGFVFVKNSYGTKTPDKFAEIYIVEQTKADTIKVHDFFSNMMAYEMTKAEYQSAVVFERPEAETLKAKLDMIDKAVAHAFIVLKSQHVTTKVVCNATGEFTVTIKPGKYFFITKSNSGVYPTLLDCNGAILCHPVTVLKENNEQVIIEF